MMICTYLIILSTLCSLDNVYALTDITGDQLMKTLLKFPFEYGCSNLDPKELKHFGNMVINNDEFEVFCKKRDDGIFFYAMIGETRANGSKKFFTEVWYNPGLARLHYLNSKGLYDEFSLDTRYELEPKEASHEGKPVKHEIIPSTIVYHNQVAPEPLKSDLDGIWSFLKEHCQKEGSVRMHGFVISIHGAMLLASFHCVHLNVYIGKTKTTAEMNLLANGHISAHHFSIYYSLKNGQFSAPMGAMPCKPWGLLQFRPRGKNQNLVNLLDKYQSFNMEEIRFPLEIFTSDLDEILIKMTNPIEAPSRSSKVSVSGVVVNGEVLMKISRTDRKDASSAAMVKIEAYPFAPQKSAYFSQDGFYKVSGLPKTVNKLDNIEDYYIKGKFQEIRPEYSSEYVDMRLVRTMLTDTLEHPMEEIPRNNLYLFVTVHLVYQKRMSLEAKINVFNRVIELQNLKILRLQRDGNQIVAFSDTFNLVYFFRKNFATEDGVLEDALSVRLRKFDESSCQDCVKTNLKNDWTIHHNN